jgi:hypothetical protein
MAAIQINLRQAERVSVHHPNDDPNEQYLSLHVGREVYLRLSLAQAETLANDITAALEEHASAQKGQAQP